MAAQDWFDKDFYAVLGVPHDADGDAIKKAYRKLARTNHPDANEGDPAAEQRFKEIGEAHAVLADPEQRRQYDAIRAMAAGGARFTAGGQGGSAGSGFEDVFAQMFGGGSAGPGGRRFTYGGGGAEQLDLEDLLAGFQGGGFGGQATRGPRRGADVQARTTLPFRQAVRGDTLTLTTGDGGRVTTRIPAGVKDGQKIRLRGKGRAGDPGAPAGDLLLTVTVEPHPVFGRRGDDLTVDVPVTVAEAALGGQVAVPTLEGGTVTVRLAPGTPQGRVLRLRGRGISRGRKGAEKTGDLLATVQVVVPTDLGDAEREALETLAEHRPGADARAELYARARA